MLPRLYGKEIRYCSNRKEIKDHGDTGILLGSPIKDGDKVVIIEDATTSGKSIEETFPIIMEQGQVEIIGLMVSLNRMEKGKGEKSALAEIKEKYGFEANAIVTMEDVIEHLYNKEYKGKVLALTGKSDVQADYRRLDDISSFDGITVSTPDTVNHLMKDIDGDVSIISVKKEYKKLLKKEISPSVKTTIKYWMRNI